MRLLLMLIVSSSFLFAQQKKGTSNNELVQNLVRVSGMEEQLQSIPSSILPPLNQALVQVEAEVFDEQRLSEIEADLYQMSLEEYGANFSDAEKLLIIDWFQTPLGKKIVKIENAEDDSYTFEDSLRAINMADSHKNNIDVFIESFEIDTLFHLMVDGFTPIMMEAVVRNNLALQKKTNKEVEAFLLSDTYSNMLKTAKTSAVESAKADKLEFYIQYSLLDPSELAAYSEFNQTKYGNKFLQVTLNLLGNFFESLLSETRLRFKAAVQKQAEMEN